MTRRYLVVLLAAVLVSGSAYGEARRTAFTWENKMPDAKQLEVGLVGAYREIPDEFRGDTDSRDEYTGGPYLRYGLTENLAAFAEFPFTYIDPRAGDSDQGPADASAGFEFVAWEDVFGFPYILPHVTVSFPTGDEDKGMGSGKTLVTAGASVGTTVEDVFHFVVDGSYTFFREEENVAEFSGSLIWDLSDQFSLLAEAKVTDEQKKEGKDTNHPLYFLGGMSYRANDNLQFSVYGGGSKHADEDVLAGAKVSYSF